MATLKTLTETRYTHTLSLKTQELVRLLTASGRLPPTRHGQEFELLHDPGTDTLDLRWTQRLTEEAQEER